MASITEQAPKIAKLWHPTKNGSVLPSSVPAFRKTKYWWQCALGHEYEARPADLTRKPDASPCPFCKGRRVLIGFNDLNSRNPDVAAEWHPIKNGDLTPEEVTYSSAKNIWWYSNLCGHEWQEQVCERTRERHTKGCRVCNGNEISAGVNDLATTHPDIARLWHPSKNIKSAQEVMAGARTKQYWWLGDCGHEWKAPPVRMSSPNRLGSGCPYCCGKKILVGFNDLATTNKELSKEWHPTKNGAKLPIHVSQWSDVKVWWQCRKNSKHEWMAVPRGRNRGKGCPHCVHFTSKPELALYEELLITYPDAQNGTTLPIKWGKAQFAKVDILIPSLQVIVEYDGWYWHKHKQSTDLKKTQALIDAGYKVIRVRVLPLEFLKMKHKDLTQVAAIHGEDAKELADKIIKLL